MARMDGIEAVGGHSKGNMKQVGAEDSYQQYIGQVGYSKDVGSAGEVGFHGHTAGTQELETEKDDIKLSLDARVALCENKGSQIPSDGGNVFENMSKLRKMSCQMGSKKSGTTEKSGSHHKTQSESQAAAGTAVENSGETETTDKTERTHGKRRHEKGKEAGEEAQGAEETQEAGTEAGVAGTGKKHMMMGKGKPQAMAVSTTTTSTEATDWNAILAEDAARIMSSSGKSQTGKSGEHSNAAGHRMDGVNRLMKDIQEAKASGAVISTDTEDVLNQALADVGFEEGFDGVDENTNFGQFVPSHNSEASSTTNTQEQAPTTQQPVDGTSSATTTSETQTTTSDPQATTDVETATSDSQTSVDVEVPVEESQTSAGEVVSEIPSDPIPERE